MEAENFLINKDFPVYLNGQPLEDFGFIEIAVKPLASAMGI